ncbi:MAG: hypothetical protein NC489_40520 [Ruminococcus flavefaciens]|nr:hypothetical protein [Ruminococcus flavefaciens]
MEMRQHALGQAREAFAESRDEIFYAMEVINEILEYAKREGLVALAKDEFFRQKGEPHILDAIERKGRKVPLKEYLAFGLEHISNGDDFEVLDAFLVNRYYANSYTRKDAYISYVYLIGITNIAQGLNFGQILECFQSLIPDSEEEAFDAFASMWDIGGKGVKKIGVVIQFRQKK